MLAGSWAGNIIDVAHGGTGLDLSAATQGSLTYFSNTGVLSALAAGEAGKVLTSNGAGADPSWSTVTRSATFVVAASDSAASSKKQADYVCDGVDDQVEIQAAIDALPANGGKVLLLEGTFILDAPNDFYVAGSKYSINVNKNNLQISGSKGTVLKLKNGINIGTASNLYLATLNIGGNNITIKNIHFNNNYTNVTADYNVAIWGGITGAKAQYVDISDNYFEGHKKWAIYGDGGGYFWKVHDNMIIPNDSAGGIGFHNGPKQSQIINNTIAAWNNTLVKVGIFVDSVDNTQILGNTIRNAEIGIECYDTVNTSQIADNMIVGTTGSTVGIYLSSKNTPESSNSDNTIYDNFISSFNYGIKLNDAYNIDTIIRNNKFQGSIVEPKTPAPPPSLPLGLPSPSLTAWPRLLPGCN